MSRMSSLQTVSLLNVLLILPSTFHNDESPDARSGLRAQVTGKCNGLHAVRQDPKFPESCLGVPWIRHGLTISAVGVVIVFQLGISGICSRVVMDVRLAR